jgi:hypothetical protein
VRKIGGDLALALDALHRQDRIHGDLKPLNIVRVHAQSDDFTTFFSWQLIDFDVSCLVDGPFGTKPPSSGYCPPEMARVLLDGGGLDAYKAKIAYDLWSFGAVLYHLGTGKSLWHTNQDDSVSRVDLQRLASWNKRKLANRLADFPVDTPDAKALRDLVGKLLEPEPAEREMHFAAADGKSTPMAMVRKHPFLEARTLETATLESLDTRLRQIQIDVSAIRDLTQENLYELRRTREALMRGIYEATEVITPTAFIIVRERLKSEDDEAARLSMNIKDDGTGVAAEGEHVDRLKECSTWLNLGARFARGVAKCSPTAICDAVAEACDELVVGEEVFLYLINELTGEPVRPTADDESYPLRITRRSGHVEKLLPAMQAGLHAMSLVNGVAGVVRLFGVPAPAVPEAWREGAATSVEILKQETSVESYDAVNEALLDEGEEKKELTFRGAALRDLRSLLEDKLPKFAGLNRIGDEEGTAVWTLLTDPKR